jgi:hypothetical protein
MRKDIDIHTFFVELGIEPTEQQLEVLKGLFENAEPVGASYRTPEQIAIDKVQAERDRFDLDNWKERSKGENLSAQICYIADEQTMFRRNIDSLTTLRKSFTGDGKNDTLKTTVDAALTKFIGVLAVTNLTAKLIANLSSELTAKLSAADQPESEPTVD